MTLVAQRDRGVDRRAGAGARVMVWAGAIAVGLASGLACVGVRLFYRLLQWIFVGSAGLLPQAAAMLSPERRVLTPMLGAVFAMLVLGAVRRWAGANPFVEYVEAVRFEEGQAFHLPRRCGGRCRRRFRWRRERRSDARDR